MRQPHVGKGGQRSSLAARVTALVVASGLLMSCGAAQKEDAVTDAATDSSTSSPFAVGWVPDGFDPFVAGRGTDKPTWSEDCCGSIEPFVILAPTGKGSDLSEHVVVSVTGYAGYQGGLEQAAGGQLDDQETFEVDGRRAIFAERRRLGDEPGDDVWSNVVVAREDDLAVRVVGHGSREDLAEVASRVRPFGQDRPPDVDLPEGLAVVGRAGADLVVAFGDGARLGSDAVPGPVSAHGAAWDRDRTTLNVMTVPGGAGDLGALLGLTHFVPGAATTSDVSVADRPAVSVEVARTGCDPGPCDAEMRVVVSRMENGDLLVVSASGNQPLPDAELLRVAESVVTTDTAEWDAFVVGATGGPGLHPDKYADEIARGVAGTTEWLLQTVAAPDDGTLGGSPGAVGVVANPCLKTSAGQRVCADGSLTTAAWGSLNYTSQYDKSAPDPALNGFLVVTSTIEATTLRVTVGDEVVTAPLALLPGPVPRWAGVAFVDRPYHRSCASPPPIVDPGPITRVELLDAGGAPVRCLDEL